MGYVYLMSPAEPVTPYRVKIGWATDPVKRLRECQTGSPVILKLLWTVEVEWPVQLERALHSEFALSRHHGEWFDLGDDPVPTIEQSHSLKVAQELGWMRNVELSCDYRDNRPGAQEEILTALAGAGHPLTKTEIHNFCPARSHGTLATLLNKLQRKGLVRSPKWGTWELTNEPRSVA